MARYLILDVDCSGEDYQTMVHVVGTEAAEPASKERAVKVAGRHLDWREHGDGWWAPTPAGELRIIDLGS